MKTLRNFKQGINLTAKTFAGLEDVLAVELKQLGAQDVKTGKRVVLFRGDKSLIYKTNYLCRTALRILMPISIFPVKNEEQLYEKIVRINWKKYFDVDKSILINTKVFHSAINHSHFASLKAKDAIADYFRQETRRRPNIDKENPDIIINLHINKDKCTISLDSSGQSLNKRGYRIAADKAPINEILAAGMIRLTGWKKDGDFIDPMCGSGTIAIEAAMDAMQIPAAYYRKRFAFMNWNDFEEELWYKIKEEANEKICEYDFPIIASDKSFKAFGIARSNLKNAGLHKDVTLLNKAFDKINPENGKGILLFNPPYGERLESDGITGLYSHIGDVLKSKFAGYEAWLITANPQAAKSIGLRPSQKITLFNGPLECRLLKFELYQGSRKGQKHLVGSNTILVNSDHYIHEEKG